MNFLQKLSTVVATTLFFALPRNINARITGNIIHRDSSNDAWNFNAYAIGAQEVPDPVITDTTASLKLEFSKDLSQVKYELDVFHGEAITVAHLHCAVAGTNGPVVVLLAGEGIDVGGPGGVDVDGELASGVLTQDDFPAEIVCGSGFVINNVASLFAALLNNEIYLNVHAESSPPGLVRGQFFPMARSP